MSLPLDLFPAGPVEGSGGPGAAGDGADRVESGGVEDRSPEMGGAELEALLLFLYLPRLGDRRRRALLESLGSARAVLRAGSQVLPAPAVAALGQPSLRERARRGVAVVEGRGTRVRVVDRSGYPEALLELEDPPTALFLEGDTRLLARPTVAVVGTRRCTRYGMEAAERFGAALAGVDIVVASGLARGIDAAAHRGALPGPTLAVLGCGTDVEYPHENAALQRAIRETGLVASEFPPGTPATRYHFPQRNRILAALARAIVVVEAPVRSGALITVDHALDLGREVFVVPGPVTRETSAGSNHLIRDGATLALSPEDVLQFFGITPPEPPNEDTPEPPAEVTKGCRAVWGALGQEGTHVEEVARRARLPVGRALQALLELELAGRARQLPGLRFVRA